MDRLALTIALIAALTLSCTSTAPVPQTSPPATVGPSGVAESPGAVESPGGSSSPEAIREMPACDLIFKTEAAAAIGVSIEASQQMQAEQDGDQWLNDCVYWRHVFNDQAPLQITLSSGDTYIARYEDLKAQPGTSPIAGLGDEAIMRLSTISGLNGPVGALFVKIGHAVLGLSLGIVDMTDSGDLLLAGDGEKQQQILVSLAGIAVERLTSPPAEAGKTCDLLTLDEAGAAIGLPLATAEEIDEHDEWGPSCQYKDSGSVVKFYVGVTNRPEGRQHFDTCKATGETVLGVGDEAFFGGNDCLLKVGYYFIESPVLVRSGETVITVGQSANLEYERSREVVLEIGRKILERLGFAPGSTPPPVAADVLTHPCTVISDAEVSQIVGATIASHTESSVDDTGLNGVCYYFTDNPNIMPLHLSLSHGPLAVSNFSTYHSYAGAGKTPVAGVGDDALTDQFQGQADQPLVNLYVRSGEAVLELYLGPIRQSADFSTTVAPGDPATQLAMLRQLAGIILPRLFNPSAQ